MKWKIFSFLELSSCVGICLWWALPFIVTLIDDLFSPIERMLLPVSRMSELSWLLCKHCHNVTNSNNTVVTFMTFMTSWHRGKVPPNIRDIQCLDKTDRNTIILETRSVVITIPISSLLTRGWASWASSFRLKQFVGIFTIFLVWVLQLSLGLSKWERTSCVSSWCIHPLWCLLDSCSEWCHHYPGSKFVIVTRDIYCSLAGEL